MVVDSLIRPSRTRRELWLNLLEGIWAVIMPVDLALFFLFPTLAPPLHDRSFCVEYSEANSKSLLSHDGKVEPVLGFYHADI